MTRQDAEAVIRQLVVEWYAQCPPGTRFDMYEFALWLRQRRQDQCLEIAAPDPFRLVATWAEDELSHWSR